MELDHCCFPLGQSGIGNLQKQVLKLLNDAKIEKSSDVLDSVTAWCVRAGNTELLTFKEYPEEARASVIADLIVAFVDIRKQYLGEE